MSPTPPPLLRIASGNCHKVEEIRAILGTDARVEGADPMPEVEESAPDFVGNARLKALALSALQPDEMILADDSGLEVDALHGTPGVHTARYAGANASDAQNRHKLLTELQRLGATDPAQRQARFRCVLALAQNGQILAEFDGTCPGRIATSERGQDGFGYDSLFIPQQDPPAQQTFAELPAATKHALSHRGLALEQFRRWWQQLHHPTV